MIAIGLVIVKIRPRRMIAEPCLDKEDGVHYKDGNMTGNFSLPARSKLPMTFAVLLFAAWGTLSAARGGELKKEYERWVRRSWTTADGLPQNTVYALTQGADGCMWIGSEGGLARFDGAEFKIFRRRFTPGLASDSITSLSTGRDGSLWIGTFGGGLVRQRDGKFARIEGMISDRIWSLRHDSEGILWIIAPGGGFYCLEPGRSPALAVVDDLPDEQVTAVAGSMERTLWIGTRKGLASIRGGRQTIFNAQSGLAGDHVYCLFIDSRGSLWSGTTTGLSRIDARGVLSFSTSDGLVDGLVRAISEDALGRMWIGTDRGVTILDCGGKPVCATPAGLAGDAVMAICRDRENGMWVGTAAGGLNYWRRNEVLVHGPEDGLSGTQVTAICADGEGRLWVGTRGQGLNRRENGNWRFYSGRDGLAGGFITSLLADSRGRIWIGSLDAGLQVMDQEKFIPGDPRGPAAGRSVLSLFLDQRDGLWAGTDGHGIDACQDGRWRHHGPAGGLKGIVITAFAQDRQGTLWAGSADDGLHALQGATWRRYTTADGLPGDTVYAIHADEKGGVWLGTDSGLGLYSQGRFFGFRAGARPLNEAILSILEDAAGRLWMSSLTGIFSVRRSELESAAPLAGRGAHCRIFGEMSGLKSTVCAGGFQPAGCRDHAGRLWFPTQKGLVEIDPQGLEAPPPPRPKIERFLANGMTVPPAGTGRLPAGSERLDFHYAAPAFSDPQQIEFSSRLQGLEDDWSAPGRERIRRFTGIPAGSYAFRLRARGQGGTWSDGEAVLRFTVAEHFHRGAGFRFLLLAGAGSALVGLHYFRRQRARRRLDNKYRSSALGDDRIAEYAARLERTMEKDKPYLDPDLTLAKLAEAAAIPAKHLSQVINEHYRLNFNDFVNRRRVEEAKHLLLDPAAREFKLLRIAFASGFNSKSVFNAAFRKHAGASPSEFRRLLGGG